MRIICVILNLHLIKIKKIFVETTEINNKCYILTQQIHTVFSLCKRMTQTNVLKSNTYTRTDDDDVRFEFHIGKATVLHLFYNLTRYKFAAL